VSVRPSVRLSQAGIAPSWLNEGSRKQRRTIAHGLYILTPKISAKFQWSHRQRGRQMQVGYAKIGDVRPISRYIPETLQDRDIVTMER